MFLDPDDSVPDDDEFDTDPVGDPWITGSGGQGEIDEDD